MILDLFAGGGGMSEGFRNKGFKILAHVEFDKNACDTLLLREHFHSLKSKRKLSEYNDYTLGLINKEEYYEKITSKSKRKVICKKISPDTFNDICTDIDLLLDGEELSGIIGGPPCQAYSLIGRARDANGMVTDERNYLYKEYLKFIEKYKPEFFVFENVKGIYSAKNGEIFAEILLGFEKLGYNVEHRVLNSSRFNVPQNRERVIINGWRNDLNINSITFLENDFEITVKEALYDLPKLHPKDSTSFSNSKNQVVQHEYRFVNDRDKKIYKIAIEELEKNNRKLSYNDLPKELKNHKNTTTFLDRFKVLDKNKPAHTIVAHLSKDGHHFIHPDLSQLRSISVREAARLQTFPDNYYFESSRTAAYIQIGNAVPPKLAEVIATSIKNELKKHSR